MRGNVGNKLSMANLVAVVSFTVLMCKSLVVGMDSSPVDDFTVNDDGSIQDGGEVLSRHKRLITMFDLWTTGEIHYEIVGQFDVTETKKIRDMFDWWSSMTCVNFIYHDVGRYSGQRIQVTSEDTGCWSYSGRMRTVQPMNLQSPDCTRYTGDIAHEIGHVLGLKHEHTRPDRDDYITVTSGNADTMKAHNFFIYNGETLGVPYDYGSVMHYGPYEYSKSTNVKVLTAKGPYAEYIDMAMGQRHLPSFFDVKSANLAYQPHCGCGSSSVKCKRGGIPNKKKGCSECICPDGFGGPDCSRVVGTPGCSGIIDVTSTEQCVETPHYGGRGYTVGDTCNWLLRAESGAKIDMYIGGDVFNIPTVDDRCFHWMEFKTEIPLRGPRFCGSSKPALTSSNPVTSGSNEAMINFNGEYNTATGAGAKVCFKLNTGNQVPGPKVPIPTDNCTPNPCHNGGACVTNDNGYSCNCPSGFGGINCENNCLSRTCRNGGTYDCVNDKCLCRRRYRGSECQFRRRGKRSFMSL